MVDASRLTREHLYAHLARLDLLIQREVWRWRHINSPAVQGADEFRGLYVSDAEVDAVLNGVYPGGEQVAQLASGEEPEGAFGAAIARAEEAVAACEAAAQSQGVVLRLVRLQAMFELTDADVDALLIALAPETDLRYERLYAYLQDDVTRKRPSVSLILNLLYEVHEARVAGRERFAPQAPLLRHDLVVLLEDPAIPGPPLLARYVKVDSRIVTYLLAACPAASSAHIDERLAGACRYEGVGPVLADLRIEDVVREQLGLLAASRAGTAQREGSGDPLLVVLQGETGTCKYAAAQSLCATWGRSLLQVDTQRLLGEREAEALLRLAVREAYLGEAALYWRGYDQLLDSGPEDARRTLQREALHEAVRTYPVTSFLPVTDVEREVDQTLLHAAQLVRIRFERPSYALRREEWASALAAYEAEPGVDLYAIAGRFRLTQGQIADAVRDAAHRAAQRGPGRSAIIEADLFAAARARTSDQLRDHAQKIEPRHEWGDLVLPPDQVAQLHELCDQMKYRHIVLGEWGFDRKLSMGKGLNALFAGPSGTGKTMAAEVIAHDLGLDLFKIDLSTVMSKYVGETEKNLERIFTAARNSNAILFFDEADALFGKRSEVRDAHDRYANVEISYLLQRMEAYDGLVVLTSNLSKNMDEAFVRRMHFTVEFPYPDAEERQRIWAIAFPEQAPLQADVDLDLLAERYRLTGGNIRNIALTAAFLAARDGGVIGMQHLLWATRREFQKMGRLANEREFAVE
ncbi:MAG: ATP-binding protein [Anaerolineae bacterium]